MQAFWRVCRIALDPNSYRTATWFELAVERPGRAVKQFPAFPT
jgi:hypothetical protein